MGSMKIERHWPKSSGWVLDVRRYCAEGGPARGRRPVLLVPGYCMNTTPLGFHPNGPSLIEFLVQRGFEVWTSNLRGQGESRSEGGPRDVGFRVLALEDLATAIAHVRSHTETRAERVDVVGCSLGGTYVFAYLAHHPETHGIGSVVGIGAPLRWRDAHPLLRLAFSSPAVVRRLRVSGTRSVAGLVLPLVAARAPGLLSIYMNTSIVDLSRADELVKTVEDPIPKLNAEISRWFKSGDLMVDGVNVTEALRGIDRPLLCVVANRDGIVPPAAARSALEVIGSEHKTELGVGDDETWFAHADLFISRLAQERVFAPLSDWLLARA
ncbi:MAG: alpha/beta fold hydrolase [Sorangiineae bacterium PRO1]|nr:alpha/beta fold hydrolase [Sorangiineae bacterium PRO1]